tara:strand:+ start:473 stop:1045 length:573 start_codon:yes stop_codon:yes gene_type:complete
VRLFLIVSFFSISLLCSAQKLDLDFYKSLITACDSVEYSEDDFLVIYNGVPMTERDFKKSQRGLNKSKEFFQVSILGKEKLQSAVLHAKKEAFIIISDETVLKVKDLKSQIKSILEEFPKPNVIPVHKTDLGLPYLFVDKKAIPHEEFWNVLQSLKKEGIQGIVRSSQVPWCLYGENSKNGGIFITTQNK